MTAGAPRRAGPGAGAGLSVELTGIPGSGKSRRARLLAQHLAERGIVVGTPQARLGPSVPTALRLTRKALATGATAVTDPVATARLLRAIARSRQPGLPDLAGRAVQLLVAQDAAARAARSGGVSILDEGPVQALWSIGLRGDVTPVLGALPRGNAADLLVVVRVPPEVALARLTRRRSRHSRTQSLGERERLAELQRGARLLDRLVEWWQDRSAGSGAVMTLDGTADDTADHDLLRDRIVALVGAGERVPA